MEQLINEIIPPSKRASALALLNNPDTQKLVRQSIGNMLMDNGLVASDPLDQLLLIISKANFADTEDECMIVTSIIYQYIQNPKGNCVLPKIHLHRGIDLAGRCLVSLSLFYQAMERIHQRHGAPSPHFYRQVGIKTFSQNHQKEIAEHFQSWETFLGEMFIIKGYYI